MAMITYNNIFVDNMIALTTDRSMDFSQIENELHLDNDQRDFLSLAAGSPISEEINIRQVHSDNILVVDKCFDGRVIEADGIITDQKNVPIVIRTADCLPVFLYENNMKCIGLIHCGWRSTQKKILQKALVLMKDKFSCDVNKIKAALGPSIRKCCYNVGKEFLTFFKNVEVKNDDIYFDLVEENRAQLVEQGFQKRNIFDSNLCTCCDGNYFSFRREGEKAGRMVSLMMMRN